jgi:hypothetical protein
MAAAYLVGSTIIEWKINLGKRTGPCNILCYDRSMRARHILMVVLLAAGCGEDGSGGGDTSTDSAADTGGPDTFDPCSRYPNACNLDSRNPHAPYDCCASGTTCCALCNDETMCQLNYECLATCPETLPCTGSAGAGGFSCYYDPSDFTATVYCPVPSGSPPDTTVPCTADCATGITCAFEPDPWGDAALCCPDGTACATSGFGLPFCE